MLDPRTPHLGSLGRAIEHYRKKAELSQEALGARCGLLATHVSRLERGISNPSYESLIRLAIALETTVGELTALADELYDELPASEK
jgi:transcriptional regulator with XRE-family HTH domain